MTTAQDPPATSRQTDGWLTAKRMWFIGLTVPLLLGGLSAAVFTWWTNRDVTAAERIDVCLARHSLSKAHDQKHEDRSNDHVKNAGGTDGTVFASCQWPPPGYADPDGYSEIEVISAPGPGTDEASDADLLDRIRATCNVVELGYSIGTQGYYSNQEPFRAARGSVIRARGGLPWTGDAPYPYPSPDEIVVVHNGKIGLSTARCT